ncbi:hypothetical protein F3Y22_tig00003507pilonHSYRG00110 [Hibiscus syriacus]|uniref:Uncharacterized protein n=1 Tax=Hibiscus syriacus TaxID=106335 RepID=A0A6A3CQX0_HIBSY|nr:hypothetical protein F3Y22_tig00003507pilonHSYRG00110 [Hibiscus syriacus]
MITRIRYASYKLQNGFESPFHPYKLGNSASKLPGNFPANIQGLQFISNDMGKWKQLGTHILVEDDSPPGAGSGGSSKFNFSLWSGDGGESGRECGGSGGKASNGGREYVIRGGGKASRRKQAEKGSHGGGTFFGNNCPRCSCHNAIHSPENHTSIAPKFSSPYAGFRLRSRRRPNFDRRFEIIIVFVIESGTIPLKLIEAKRCQTSVISSQSFDVFFSSIAGKISNSPPIIAPFTTPPVPSCSLCRFESAGVNLGLRRRRRVRRWSSQRFGRVEIELSAIQKFELIFTLGGGLTRHTRRRRESEWMKTGLTGFDRFRPVRTSLTGLNWFDRSDPTRPDPSVDPTRPLTVDLI